MVAPVLREMHEATEEILWSDDIIKNIPVPLVESEEDVDFVQCMDAMMVSLNEGQITTEFIPLWLYMLMNGADPFRSGDNTRFDRVSQGLTSDRIKIAFPHDYVQTRVQALSTTLPIQTKKKSPAFRRTQEVEVLLDNKAFKDWYSDPQNLQSAKRFATLFCIVLFRCTVKQAGNVYNHCQFRLTQQLPQFTGEFILPCYWNIELNQITAISEIVGRNLSVARGMLKFLLYSFRTIKREITLAEVDAFNSYALDLPFKGLGLDLVKLGDRCLDIYKLDCAGLKSYTEESGMKMVKDEFSNYIKAKKAIAWYVANPTMTLHGKTFSFVFWKYGRYFDGRVFLGASVNRNPSLTGFFIGLLPTKDRGALDMWALQEFERETDYAFEKGKEIRALKMGFSLSTGLVPNAISGVRMN